MSNLVLALIVHFSYLEHLVDVSARIGQELRIQVINLVHGQWLDRTLLNLLQRLHANRSWELRARSLERQHAKIVDVHHYRHLRHLHVCHHLAGAREVHHRVLQLRWHRQLDQLKRGFRHFDLLTVLSSFSLYLGALLLLVVHVRR